MIQTRDIQARLKALGFDPGAIDNAMGSRTRAAIVAFQISRGFEPDGVVGPITSKALFGQVEIVLPWISEARRYFGMHEVANAKTLDKALKMDASEIPWCGSFAALCMATVPQEPLPINPLWARNWLKLGVECGAEYGAVAVFSRGTGGHVGFLVGHDKTYCHILGGNQSNRVSIAKVSKSRLLGYRSPKTYRLSGKIMPYSTINATVTTNEG